MVTKQERGKREKLGIWDKIYTAIYKIDKQ